MNQLQQHKIDLEWVEIGCWFTTKTALQVNSKSVLVKYKELKEGEDIIQVGIDKLLGGN